MGMIVISENVSLDGVIEDPAGGEGFARGGWVGRVGDRGGDEAGRILLEEALRAEAVLLGRHSYEFFAGLVFLTMMALLADKSNAAVEFNAGWTQEASAASTS